MHPWPKAPSKSPFPRISPSAFAQRSLREAYASEREVIGEGLLALEAQEADIEHWLRETVAPTYDRIKAGQEALIPIDEVFDGLLKRSEARKTQKTS